MKESTRLCDFFVKGGCLKKNALLCSMQTEDARHKDTRQDGADRRMRVVTLDDAEVARCCRELEAQTLASGFAPEVVVAIARGGIRVADGMFAGVRHLTIDVHRPGTSRKRRLGGVFAAVRWLPRCVRDRLRIFEARRLAAKPLRAVTPPVERVRELSAALLGVHRVLVVDDAVDSGASLAAVKRIVCAGGVADVRAASIALTRADAVETPDYHVFQPGTLVRFPWSMDARGRRNDINNE